MQGPRFLSLGIIAIKAINDWLFVIFITISRSLGSDFNYKRVT